MKVYVLLLWWYDGDSWISNSFLEVFLTKQQAADLIPADKKMIEGFIDYKTKQESPIYIEGYEAKEFGQYGSENRYEIREIDLTPQCNSFKESDLSEWNTDKVFNGIEHSTTFDGQLSSWNTVNIVSIRSIRFAEQVQYCNQHNIDIENYPLVGMACMVKETEHPFLFQEKFK